MVRKGDCLKVKTKTLQDVFGTCFYEVVETDLPSPEKGRNDNDGVRCVMLGGSGPAARPGFSVQDSQWKIAQDIASGITEVVSKEQASKLMRMQVASGTRQAPGEGVGRPATGVVEMD